MTDLDVHPELLEAAKRKLTAEAESFEASAHHSTIEAEMAAIHLVEVQDEERRRQASRYWRRIYHFNGAVRPDTVGAAVHQLDEWSQMYPREPLTVVFNSPGGSVIDGMAFWDHLETLKSKGHHLTTVVRGYAASMAGILLQAGDDRLIGKESYLMIHEISAGAMGKIGEIKDEVDFLNRISERVVDIFVNRSGGKITKAKFKRLWERKDVWLDSDQSIAHGFADAVG